MKFQSKIRTLENRANKDLWIQKLKKTSKRWIFTGIKKFCKNKVISENDIYHLAIANNSISDE